LGWIRIFVSPGVKRGGGVGRPIIKRRMYMRGYARSVERRNLSRWSFLGFGHNSAIMLLRFGGNFR
jgi:hypothetical protein